MVLCMRRALAFFLSFCAFVPRGVLIDLDSMQHSMGRNEVWLNHETMGRGLVVVLPP